jgi:hypothetical protein
MGENKKNSTVETVEKDFTITLRVDKWDLLARVE